MKMYKETRTRHLALMLLAGTMALLLITGLSLVLTRSQAQAGMEITAWTRSKTVNRTVAAPGDTLTYTIMVQNTGAPVAARMTDTLPTQVTYVPGSLVVLGAGTGDVTGDTITWSEPDFGYYETVFITFSAQIDSGITYDIFANTAQITGTGSLIEFSSEDTTVVTTIGNLDNDGTYKTVDPQGQVEPEDVLTYTIKLANDSSDPVPGVQVVDELPSGLSLVDGSVTVDEGSYVAQDNTITWTLDMGGNWGNIDMVFQAEALPYNGLVTNTAKLTAPGHQPLTLTAPAVNVYQGYPNIEVEKTVSPSGGRPGDNLTYYVHVANTGDSRAETVWMTDVLPSQVIFQSAEVSRGDFDETDGVITWEVSKGGTVVLPALEEAAMTITVQISPDIVHSAEFVNTAVVTSAGTLVQDQVVARVTTTSYAYFPYIVRRWPPVPYTPTLLDISNPDEEPDYTVQWTYNFGGELSYYLLQEATDANFTANVQSYYPGTNKSYTFSDQGSGTYYYRVRGHNSYGNGDWSNTESTTVVTFSYFDDFSDYNSGWPREWEKTRGALYQVRPYEHPQCPGDDCAYDDGDGYIVARRKTSKPYTRYGPGVTIPSANYEIEYDVRWWDAQYHASYKVFFGADSTFDNYYSLDVMIDDPSVLPSHCSYRLVERDGGGEEEIKGWQQEGEIDCHVRTQATTPWNHWKIRRENNFITIYVNDEKLGSWYDSTFGTNRYFGVGATLYEGLTPSKPEFDNFSVEILP